MTTQNLKYALVTGATSGIGYELAKLFAKDSHGLVIVARSGDELQRTAREFENEFNVPVVTITKDLFKRENAFELCEEIKAKGLQIEYLVNNAGHGYYGEFIEQDLQRELDIIELNVITMVILTKHFVEEMVARGSGKVLNLSSIDSKMPGPWHVIYHATKAFVQSFSEGIRSELKDSGVSVTALLPGATDTDFFRKADMEESKMVQENKLSDPAKVAEDGYKAMMDGKDMIVSGAKSKMQVAMGNVLNDEVNADMMKNQQAPVDQDKDKK